MRADELLVLNYAGFSQHVGSLFARLGRSQAFRDLFLRDPTGITWKIVFPGYGQPPERHLSAANRFFFALLSNQEFLRWAEGLQARLEQEATERLERSRRSGAEKELQNSLEQRADGESEEEHAARLEATRDRELYSAVAMAVDRANLYEELVGAIRDHADKEMYFALFAAPPGSGGKPGPDPAPGGPQFCGGMPHEKQSPFPDLCPDPEPPDPWGPVTDTWAVEETVAVHEIAVVAFAVVAVVVAVTQIDVTPKPAPPAIPRTELQKLSAVFADEVNDRATRVRRSGLLTDPKRFGTQPGL